MNQYQGVFKRYEIKYLIDEVKYQLLREKLQEYMMEDQYGEIMINNIYFDTSKSLLIRTSLEKPVYKEKLRLRSYGIPDASDNVFIELKKKYKGVVYKRRVKVRLYEAEQYLYHGVPLRETSQITREIDWFLSYYKELIPAMYISYQRVALFDRKNVGVRITFDWDILWREDNLRLGVGPSGVPILSTGQRLMEIKIPGVIPLWLSHLLNELEIYPLSLSKYGIAYQRSLQNKQTINNKLADALYLQMNPIKIKGEIIYA